MITLSGMLNITTRGALLLCSIGRFIVDDPRLRDVPVGKHDGFFEIQKIELTVAQKSSGQVQLGVLAVLKGYSLQTAANPLKDRQLSLWADTDFPTQAVAESVDLTTENAAENLEETVEPYCEEPEEADFFAESTMDEPIAVEEEAPADPEPSDTALLPEQVTLDWTLSRDQLKNQIQQLQAQGYQFQKETQLFLRVA